MSIKKQITKSSILDISIRYKGDRIKFNLGEELVIDENQINKELKEQPSYYGFLLVLCSKLRRVRDDLKAQHKKVYYKKYIYHKSQTNTESGRITSNDLAEALANNEPDFQAALDKYNKAEEQLGTIESCVRSFEQRSHLIQSISANLRDEKYNS